MMEQQDGCRRAGGKPSGTEDLLLPVIDKRLLVILGHLNIYVSVNWMSDSGLFNFV